MGTTKPIQPGRSPTHTGSHAQSNWTIGTALRLVSSRREQGKPFFFYDFSDLIGLRTVKQLTEQGVSGKTVLRRALVALRDGLSHVQAPLTELRVLSDGRDVVVERGWGRGWRPLSGQFVLNFEIREIGERVSRDARALGGGMVRHGGWNARAISGNTQEAIGAYEPRVCTLTPRNSKR